MQKFPEPRKDSYWGLVLLIFLVLALVVAASTFSDELWDEWMNRYKRYDASGVGLGLWHDGAQDLQSVRVEDGETIDTPSVEIRNHLRLHRIDSVDDLPDDLESGEADIFLMNLESEMLLIRKHAGVWVAALIVESTTDSVDADDWKTGPDVDVCGLRYQDGETTWYLRLDVS